MSYAIHNKDKVFQNIDYIKRQLDMLYEENMQFKATINCDINSYNKLAKYSDELEDRIDKALELIYANAYDTERKEIVDDLWGNIEELVDILKGSDKE